MKIKTIKDKQFCEYYWGMKNLYEIGQKYNYGSGVSLHSPFTERLCKEIYKLKESKGTDFDAQNLQNQSVEIKATLKETGTTTMSKKHFDVLYWMHFNLKEDLVSIYLITGEKFRTHELYKPKFEVVKDRVSVDLWKFIDTENLIDVFTFKK